MNDSSVSVFPNNKIAGKKSLTFYVLTILFSIAVPIYLMDTCITFFHEDIGFSIVHGDLAISTGFSRRFGLHRLHEICPVGPPCHIYATIPEDATHAAFINIHTNKAVKSILVYFDTEEYYN